MIYRLSNIMLYLILMVFSVNIAIANTEIPDPLIVGVKGDFAPFGIINEDGNLVGFEVELAEKLAEELGVGIELRKVTSSNRFIRLEQGSVDVLFATTIDTEQRRQTGLAIEPHYYGAGAGILMPKSIDVTEWIDLQGRQMCALQGAAFNTPVALRYRMQLKMYGNIRDAMLALQQQSCDGFIYSNVAIDGFLKDDQWADYHAPLPVEFVEPWAVFAAKKYEGPVADKISDVMAKWYRDGTIVSIASKWQVPVSPSWDYYGELWNRTDASGNYVCSRNASGRWPADCLNSLFAESKDATGVYKALLQVRESVGLDFTFLNDRRYIDIYGTGLLYTLILSTLAVFSSVGTGIVFAKAVRFTGGPIHSFLEMILSTIRSIPPLLSMYIIYFGLGAILIAKYDFSLPALFAGIVSLSLYHGALIALALIDASKQLGLQATVGELMSKASVGIRIALTNLVKGVSITAAIAVPEILSATLYIMTDQGNIHTMMIMLLTFFVIHSVAWNTFFKRAESRWFTAKEEAA